MKAGGYISKYVCMKENLCLQVCEVNRSVSTISSAEKSLKRFRKYFFLFQELVKRDFKLKYKRTALGMVWSVLSPLLTLFVMKTVFTNMFGRNTPHFSIYLFSGVIVMSCYRECTTQGMSALMNNSNVITKINIPKYLFVLSRNVSGFVNFLLTLVVYFAYCIIDHITFTPHFFALVWPVMCLVLLNIGVGMILSCAYVFFRDTTYLYNVFLTLLNYLSAVFYDVNRFTPEQQKYFLLNPVYTIIRYFRSVVIENTIPSFDYHVLMACYVVFFLGVGFHIYRKNNHEFIYYL